MTELIDDKYLSDWSGTRYGVPDRLERPGSTTELASILREANGARKPCAIQGGRTGVSGGAAPSDGELVLSLERMNQIEDLDLATGTAVVGAGVILETLQNELASSGWSFPIDLASRGSCQIGGNAATNAGGTRVVKYGSTRESILGLEAVLADGKIIGPPNRLRKNNAGYAMAPFFIGSEGTLGVISRLALKLVPVCPVRRTALLALADSVNVSQVFGAAALALQESLCAFEVMWEDFVTAAAQVQARKRDLPRSFQGKRALLLELEGHSEQVIDGLLENFAAQQMEAGAVEDAVVSDSSQSAMDLWAIRDSVAEIQAGMRPYVGFDLGIIASRHDEFVTLAKARMEVEMPQCSVYFFGHIGDGNLHALVGPCASATERLAVESLIYSLMPPLESSITAEHGVGRKRKNFLDLSRSATDVDTMKRIKRALDPHSILNPGRVFDM
ncbi:FAD-binding oxidoreductase [Herbaspirillum seropedicae]|uniref:FAD-binding oxidoreductase n=1 Tax=Herbaspirillum seropedicae TaxID=964 RepID=UPI00285E0626|nr:FAD-binding oxidoreductase [Herbaspirillum seropedicae]MDR6397497.1 FAD/FMN-containing dehydrogenase [Herbaspirillum seropedicae]